MIQRIGISSRVAKVQRKHSDFLPLAQFLHQSAQNRVLAFSDSPTLKYFRLGKRKHFR